MKKSILLSLIILLKSIALLAQVDSMIITNNAIPMEKHVYAYEGVNIVQDSVYEYAAGTNSWVLTHRYHRLEYDANGNYGRKFKLTYNSGAWDSTNYYTYKYDATGNQLQMRNYTREGNKWVSYEGYNHTYDALFGRRTATIYVLWDSKYKFRLRYYSGYDGQKNHTIYKETYNSTTPSGGTDRGNFDGMMALTEDQVVWKNTSADNLWWYGYSQEFKYGNDYKSETQTRITEKPVGTFQYKYKWDRTYDDEGRILTESEYKWNGSSSDVGSWDAATYKYSYTYYEKLTAIESFASQNKLSIYPNPVNNILHLNVTEDYLVTITDINGKVFLHQLCRNNNIDVSGLPVGLYLINVSSREEIRTSKFIKQ